MTESTIHRIYPTLLLASLASCVSASVEANHGQFEVAGSTNLVFESEGQTLELPASNLAEFGITEDEGATSIRGTISLGSPTLRVSAIQTEYAGTRDLTGLQFGGNDVIGGNFTTGLGLDLYEAILLFELIPGDTIDLAIGLGAERLSVDLDVGANAVEVQDAPTVDFADRFDEDLTIPVLGLLSAVRLGPARLAANISWLEVEIDDSELGYLDLDLQAAIDLWGPLSAALGYRKVELDAVVVDGSETNTANLTLDGPYLGLRASF